MTTLLPLNSIVTDGRLRADLGDVDELARSIASLAEAKPETHGLMHPIVVDDANNLVAGGRRFAAFTLLASNKVQSSHPAEFYSVIPITNMGLLTPAKRRMLELEENLRRKAMTWQEEILGLSDYHKMSEREALRDRETWTQEMTARFFNVSQASISVALTIAKELSNRDSEYWKCESATAAIALRAQKKLDEAAREQLRRIEVRRNEAAKNANIAAASVSTETIDLAKSVPVPVAQSTAKAILTPDQIASFYYHGDGRQLLPQIAKTTRIKHIIFDPPYAINEDNMANVVKHDRVRETHEVEPSLSLIMDFLRLGYEHIAEDGFMCMWYDLDHHEKIRHHAERIGWKVCRWPLVWCKTSNCQNQSAQYNITKATEVCYFLRRSEKSIIKTKQSKNYILADAVSSGSHPYVKPDAVWGYLLDTVSCEGDTVVDLCAGEGSSLAASFKRNRVPIGVEIDNTHIANGINYIQTQLAKPNVQSLLAQLI